MLSFSFLLFLAPSFRVRGDVFTPARALNKSSAGQAGRLLRSLSHVGVFKLSRPLIKLLQMEKASDHLKTFDGAGDVSTWLKKVELVARLKKIDDDEATLIALNL